MRDCSACCASGTACSRDRSIEPAGADNSWLRFATRLLTTADVNALATRLASIIVAAIALSADATAAPSSLVGRSNEELLEIIRGGRSEGDDYEPPKEATLPPDFWTRSPRDAALAIILANCSEETKQRVSFAIPDPPAKQAPAAGEVGIRWRGTGSGPMAGGLTILRAAGEKSQFLYSAVELEGEATKKQIAAAVNRTRAVALPSEIARQAFQVIWWLGRVKTAGDARTRSAFFSHETHAAFWITPGVPRRADVTLLSLELGEKYGEEFDADRLAGFAHFVMREAAKQQPTPIEFVTESLGAGVYPDAGLKFLRTHEQPKRKEDTDAWITETLRILREPKYRSWQATAISNLVPWQEPMRYADARIDEALLELARENLQRIKRGARDTSGFDYAAREAVRALARRDRVEIYAETMAALRASSASSDSENLLKPAALLASRHPELRADMLAYLRAQLSDLAGSHHSASELLDTAWRYDFTELTPLIQELATANADEVEHDGTASDADVASSPPRRFHKARKILLIWNEPDPLTKLKLGALYEASSAALFEPPDLLRRGFEALPESEQRVFWEFVEWMKAQRLPSNWDPKRIEWAISREALATAR